MLQYNLIYDSFSLFHLLNHPHLLINILVLINSCYNSCTITLIILLMTYVMTCVPAHDDSHLVNPRPYLIQYTV